MKHYSLLLMALLAICLVSCKKGPEKPDGPDKPEPPVNLNNGNNASQNEVRVKCSREGGVDIIPVNVNGIPMRMCFDTGCSGIHISLLELQMLWKNGKIDESDVIGTSYSSIADGSIVENGVVNIREIEICGVNEKGESCSFKVTNKEASVSLNQVAPVLLGHDVLDETQGYTVDNEKKTITFISK